MGHFSNQHPYLEKKESTIHHRISLPRRIFCGAGKFYYFFYFLKEFAIHRCGRPNCWRIDSSTNCSTAGWQITFKNNVYCGWGICDFNQLFHSVEGDNVDNKVKSFIIDNKVTYYLL